MRRHDSELEDPRTCSSLDPHLTTALALWPLALWACGSIPYSPCADAADCALQPSSNSITVVEGPSHRDPDGLAPEGMRTSIVTWRDARGAARSMHLHAYLYRYDFSFLGGQPDVAQATEVTADDHMEGHAGFGYVVSHVVDDADPSNGNSPLGKLFAPTSAEPILLQGAHHAIHRVELIYDRDREPGGRGIAIPVVIEWFVATGRDHPVWSVTWKLGELRNPANVDLDRYRMDSRGPYGQLSFDGAERGSGDLIGGIAWGDFERTFRTTAATPTLTMSSRWTYNTPGDVCFTQAWTADANAELGIIETRLADREMGYQDRVVGRERGQTSESTYPNKGDCVTGTTPGTGDARVYSMPCVGSWPYELMQYDWDVSGTKPLGEPTSTKQMGWGTPYGWLGSSSFPVFDYSSTADGRGDRAYATFIVLGPKCRFDAGGACRPESGEVATAIRRVQALAGATLSATTGEVVTTIPRGPGARDTRPIANGYDDRYAVHALAAEDNRVSFRFTPAADRPVDRPIFVIHDYTATAAPVIAIDGVERSVNTGDVDSETFVSIDPTRRELWVTINATLSAATSISINP
jgi:hypothetical protein